MMLSLECGPRYWAWYLGAMRAIDCHADLPSFHTQFPRHLDGWLHIKVIVRI